MNDVLTQLQLLAKLQNKNDFYYTDGLYVTERTWAKGLYHRKDDTVFLAACIGFTLMRYQNTFTEEELVIVNNILTNMRSSFSHFKNKDGHASYNFWKTNPSKHFPGGYFAHRFRYFMIPDDIDDSAIIHLVNRHTREEQLSLKDKMVKYAVGNLKWPDRPVKGYESFKPYNTFFVKRMPSAFDVCALCNALYFVYFYQLPINEQDEHSLELISQCLAQEDYLKRPYDMSPYYPNSILIIYHVVRLIVDLHIEPLEQYKAKLLLQAQHLVMNSPLSAMQHLILKICIQKLENSTQVCQEIMDKEKANFPFFIAGILGEVRSKWLRSLSYAKATHIKYNSSPYAEALWLEHLLLNRKSGIN